MQVSILEDLVKSTSSVLPGKEMTILEFKHWIERAENAPSITLDEAKLEWANRRSKLLQTTGNNRL